MKAPDENEANEHPADIGDDQSANKSGEVQADESGIEQQDAECGHVLCLQSRVGDEESPHETDDEQHCGYHADGWSPMGVPVGH